MNILGIEKPENLPGINILDEQKLQKRDIIFGEIYAHDFETIEKSLYYNIAIATPYKLIVPDAEIKKEEEIQLFNIVEDPYEKNNIAETNPKIVAQLKEKIATFRAD